MRAAALVPVFLVPITSCGRIGFDVLQGDGADPASGGTGGRGNVAGGTSSSDGGAGDVANGNGGAGTGGGGASFTAGTGGQVLDAGAAGTAGSAGTAGASGVGGGAGPSPDGGVAGAGGSPPSADAGDYVCTPGATELCDGRDNDCDLDVDESACAVGCEAVASPTHGYMLCDRAYNWDAAKATCEAAGLELARIDSQEENDLLLAFAFSTIITDVWIGGSDIAVEGDWRWADGMAFWSGLASPAGSAVGGAYTNWKAGEPDGVSALNVEADCLLLKLDGTWLDQPCINFARALCRTP